MKFNKEFDVLDEIHLIHQLGHNLPNGFTISFQISQWSLAKYCSKSLAVTSDISYPKLNIDIQDLRRNFAFDNIDDKLFRDSILLRKGDKSLVKSIKTNQQQCGL